MALKGTQWLALAMLLGVAVAWAEELKPVQAEASGKDHQHGYEKPPGYEYHNKPHDYYPDGPKPYDGPHDYPKHDFVGYGIKGPTGDKGPPGDIGSCAGEPSLVDGSYYYFGTGNDDIGHYYTYADCDDGQVALGGYCWLNCEYYYEGIFGSGWYYYHSAVDKFSQYWTSVLVGDEAVGYYAPGFSCSWAKTGVLNSDPSYTSYDARCSMQSVAYCCDKASDKRSAHAPNLPSKPKKGTRKGRKRAAKKALGPRRRKSNATKSSPPRKGKGPVQKSMQKPKSKKA